LPKVTLEQYRRILEVKTARDALPSDKKLAREMGITVDGVRSIMRRGLTTYDRRADGKTP
jgi:hypothetical protein